MASEHPREVIIRAVENVSDIVEITDADGRIEYVNRAFEKKTGWRSDEILGKTPASFLRSGDHEPEYYEQIWAKIASGQPWKGRITSKARDGRRIIQEAYITPIHDDGGQISHFVAIKRDITERTQLESQLLQADRLAAVGQLAAGVAHEINNPLAYILANLSFLKRRFEDVETLDADDFLEEVREILDETSYGATQIHQIVRSLGSMSRNTDARSDVDLGQVIDFALRLVDHELRGNIEIEADYKGLPSVWGNKSRLTQVFVNLLVNAIQAVSQVDGEKRIRILGSASDDEVVVRIEDSGTGMAPRIAERVFEPFFTTKDVGDGSGLGLSICYGIITGMNGSIEVDSEEGVGTAFELRIPISQELAALDDWARTEEKV